MKLIVVNVMEILLTECDRNFKSEKNVKNAIIKFKNLIN